MGNEDVWDTDSVLSIGAIPIVVAREYNGNVVCDLASGILVDAIVSFSVL